MIAAQTLPANTDSSERNLFLSAIRDGDPKTAAADYFDAVYAGWKEVNLADPKQTRQTIIGKTLGTIGIGAASFFGFCAGIVPTLGLIIATALFPPAFLGAGGSLLLAGAAVMWGKEKITDLLVKHPHDIKAARSVFNDYFATVVKSETSWDNITAEQWGAARQKILARADSIATPNLRETAFHIFSRATGQDDKISKAAEATYATNKDYSEYEALRKKMWGEARTAFDQRIAQSLSSGAPLAMTP